MIAGVVFLVVVALLALLAPDEDRARARAHRRNRADLRAALRRGRA